ncbi:hypothetical protein [Leekyejoonella antrihumi]|nr:hypothetical protein [Leekyejoonella antrihumi]
MHASSAVPTEAFATWPTAGGVNVIPALSYATVWVSGTAFGVVAD